MKTSRSLAALGLLLVTAGSSFGQAQHRGMSREQQFLLWAQTVLGKLVFWQGLFWGPRYESTVPEVACPAGRDEFIAELQKKEGLSVFEDGRFAFMVTTEATRQGKPIIHYGYEFKKLPISFNVHQAQRAGSRKMSDEELQKIADAILRETRGERGAEKRRLHH